MLHLLHVHTYISADSKPLGELGGVSRRLNISSATDFDMDVADARREKLKQGAAGKAGGKKGVQKAGSSKPGASNSKYSFKEFDPSKKLRKQGKVGTNQFKSKSKFKRRK